MKHAVFSALLRLRTALLALAFFAAVFCYLHNFFYRHGGYLEDAGRDMFLMYRNGVFPLWPLSIKPYAWSELFFQAHMSPVLSLCSLVSYAVPLENIGWFRICHALACGVIVWAMCSAADLFLEGTNRPLLFLGGGLIGLVYAMNGLTISCLGYPHYEIIFVAAGLCFLVSLFRRQRVATWIFFVLACAVREDTGFHLAAILFMLWVASFLETHLAGSRRLFLLFAILAFGADVALIAVQKVFFPRFAGSISQFQISFFDGGFPVVTWGFVCDRLAALCNFGLTLLLPLGVTAIWVLVTRKYVLLLGWLAYLPWFFLNLISNDKGRQVLSLYHGFPFILSLAWPLLVLQLPDASVGGWKRFQNLAFVFVFGLSSLVGYRASWRDAFDTFVQEMKNFRLEKTENLTLLSASLHAQPELYGRLALDQCTGCLCLDWIDQRQIRHTGRSYDTLVFFKNSMFASEMIRVGLKNQLRHCYQLADTDVLLLSNRELPAVISGRALLKPANLWLSLAQIAPLKAVRLSDGTIAQLQTDGCVLAWGPNVQLPEGTYRAEFSIESVSQADGKISAAQFFSEPVAQLTVTSQAGNFKNASSEVNGGSLPVTAVLEWNVDHAQRDERFEFRVDSLGRGRIRIRSIEVERL